MTKVSYDVCAVEGGLGAHTFSICFKRGDKIVESTLLSQMCAVLGPCTMYLMSECAASLDSKSDETIVSSPDLAAFAEHIAKRGVRENELAIAYFVYAVGDRMTTLSPHMDDLAKLAEWTHAELPAIHSPRSEGRLSPREKRTRDATYLYLVGRYVDGELNTYRAFDTPAAVRACLSIRIEFRNM